MYTMESPAESDEGKIEVILRETDPVTHEVHENEHTGIFIPAPHDQLPMEAINQEASMVLEHPLNAEAHRKIAAGQHHPALEILDSKVPGGWTKEFSQKVLDILGTQAKAA